MAKLPVGRQPFQFRPGVSPFADLGEGWLGVNTEDDPGSLQPNELQLGSRNIRQKGKHLVTRPGLIQVANLGSNVVTNWLGEAPVDNPALRIWMTTFGCFAGSGASGGTQCCFCDPNANPVFNVHGSYRATSERNACLGTFSGHLFLGDKSALREISIQPPIPGVTLSNITAGPPNVPTLIFDGFTITCQKEFDSAHYIGMEDDASPGNGRIVRWNGLSWEVDITGIPTPLGFGILRDKLVVGFGAGADEVRYRTRGAAPGTWTSVPLVGMVTSEFGNAMQEVAGDLWIASGNQEIFKLTGGSLTLTLERTVAAADTSNFGVTALCLYDDLLHYVWNTPDPDFECHLGRHDPESSAANEWVDDYKDVTADETNFIKGCAVINHRGQIYIGGDEAWIVATEENEVQGDIETVNQGGAPGSAHAVLHMVRFP